MATNLTEMVEDWVSSLPTVYFKLREALEDPDASFNDFAKIISGDSALTARLLRIVNSPFFGFPSKIETISHALTIVGTEQLSELILNATVMKQFDGVSPKLLNMESFWKHGIGCGVAARELAQYLEKTSPERYYITGMLHDIGILVIFKKKPQQAKEILIRCEAENEHLFKVEREVLGFDHAQIAQALLKEWKLPVRLVEPVAFHHNPLEATKYPEEVAITHIADILAYEMNLGQSGEQKIQEIDPLVMKRLELSPDFREAITDGIQEQFDEAIKMFL
ncbi:MAG: HDOD domain-containing protein [Nitrospinales bacterium]